MLCKIGSLYAVTIAAAGFGALAAPTGLLHLAAMDVSIQITGLVYGLSLSQTDAILGRTIIDTSPHFCVLCRRTAFIAVDAIRVAASTRGRQGAID